jgi:NAD(P)-dependent dehydrogenase (short-subunit alcohol dehydrogenase family)
MTSDLFGLNGKTALITGGSRVLGRQIALASRRAGADVIVTSRKHTRRVSPSREKCRRPTPPAA